MDLLSYQDTALHKIDPRAKLLVALFFILTVLSFGKYEISSLIPFFIFPIYFLSFGNIPVMYIVKKILMVSPFVLMIGIFNPIIDRNIIMHLAGIGISGGWISFASILIKFILTVSTAFTLIACTGFNNICFGLNRLGVPKIFTTQLLFLYRYIFVLAEEAARMIRARNLRSFNKKGRGIKSYGPLLGNFFLRTINRAERLHLAMLCRGFDGNVRVMNRFGFGLNEFLFMLIWVSIFILFRLMDVTQISGDFFMRLFL